MEALRGSNEIVTDGSRKNDYVQFLYLPPLEGVTAEERFVDLSTITLFKLRDRAALLSLKKVQLSDNGRDSLKMKIGYFFARPETICPPHSCTL